MGPGEARARGSETAVGPPERLELPGMAPAFYYTPTAGRGLKPILLYLHGRGGNPEADCTKWGQVAREFGWIVCPSGPENRGGGARGWSNNWLSAKNVVDRAVAALREKYGRRVQLRGNTLIGFSEGAFIAMNIGVREPEVFNRWLILAANDQYWGGEGQEELERRYARIKRVYLSRASRTTSSIPRAACSISSTRPAYTSSCAPRRPRPRDSGKSHEAPVPPPPEVVERPVD